MNDVSKWEGIIICVAKDTKNTRRFGGFCIGKLILVDWTLRYYTGFEEWISGEQTSVVNSNNRCHTNYHVNDLSRLIFNPIKI